MHDESPPTTTTAGGPRTAILARVGLLGIAAAALVAVALVALGSTFAPASTLAGNDGSGATGVSDEALEVVGGDLGPGHGIGGGPGIGRVVGGIEITSIDGNDLSLATVDGWTRTITVDDGTEYYRARDEITLGDLAVGDRIGFRQTREDDGTWTIDAIVVIPPHVAGEVTAIDGSTITVERRDDSTATIHVTDETEYRVDGDEATLAEVEVGMLLAAVGTENADGSLTATHVRAVDPDWHFPWGPRLDGSARHR